ncbi:hypothetical protein D5086_030521 [Populus alba]|uniref:Thaumatin-like protein n=2 Tax=Populus alba TaxID=43335 RepID=A0A4V6A955_POPAL|nr:hypothetical protein D5086_0000129160 [Populus alba]
MFTNKCPFAIWPATAPNTGHPVCRRWISISPRVKPQRIYAPWDWNVGCGARTGCNFTSRGQPACETGDCDGRLACNGLIGTPPVTLVQVLNKKWGKLWRAKALAWLSILTHFAAAVMNMEALRNCKPSVYSKMFKDACPYYYSYAFDSPAPLVNCASKEYVVTFCPSSWGGDRSSI